MALFADAPPVTIILSISSMITNTTYHNYLTKLGSSLENNSYRTNLETSD